MRERCELGQEALTSGGIDVGSVELVSGSIRELLLTVVTSVAWCAEADTTHADTILATLGWAAQLVFATLSAEAKVAVAAAKEAGTALWATTVVGAGTHGEHRAVWTAVTINAEALSEVANTATRAVIGAGLDIIDELRAVFAGVARHTCALAKCADTATAAAITWAGDFL